MSRLELRLLGGFQVLYDGRPVGPFESQKVRALLAYLACNTPRPLHRDQLAGLLWADRSQETARRNLRQALYNLRRTLESQDQEASPDWLVTDNQSIRLDSRLDLWLDVQAFDRAFRRGQRGGAEVVAEELVRASQLYGGEFLAGFYVKESPEFEEWVLGERERLREAVTQALKSLVEHYAARREHRLALHHAQRLLEIDPLSEDACRDLMRLYALLGRRNRALALYGDMSRLLEEELGVEPAQETTALYRAILDEDLPLSQPAAEAPSLLEVGPPIPLQGREDARRQLAASWRQAQSARGRVALVTGPPGIGKTRLINSFLHGASLERPTAVLLGRCYEMAPRISLQPFAEALYSAMPATEDSGEPPDLLVQLARLLPTPGEPGWDRPITGDFPALSAGGTVSGLIAEVLKSLIQDMELTGGLRPMILFVDDLQWADPPSLELLGEVASRLRGLPFWLVLACRAGEGESPAYFPFLRAAHDTEIDLITLDPLEREALERIAARLTGRLAADGTESREDPLAAYLELHGGSLPLRLVQLIHFLRDEEALETAGRDHLILRARDAGEMPEPGDLRQVLLRRMESLPSSARRLLTLAAVVGPRFDVDLLRQAAQEHMRVVEIALELSLSRWFIRHFPTHWTTHPQERDLMLWEHGARRGIFEFSHPHIRRVIYESIHPARRKFIHGEVAETLVAMYGASKQRCCEVIAHHFLQAERWEQALPHLRAAAEKAARLADHHTARFYWDETLRALEHLAAEAPGRKARRRWLELRRETEGERGRSLERQGG